MNKLLLLLGGLISIASYGQQNEIQLKYAETITAADLKEDLLVIAADSMEGRETGTIGQQKAAKYISAHFAKSGIPAYNGSDYYQQYFLYKKGGYEATVVIDGKEYAFLKDFYFLPGAPITDISATDFAFAGYGIDDEVYSDYSAIDVTNKWVLAWSGEPFDKKGYSLITEGEEPSEWSTKWRKKVAAAKEKGAAGIFVVDTNAENNAERYSHYIKKGSLAVEPFEKEDPFTCVFVSSKMGSDLMLASKKSEEKLRAYIRKKGKPASGIVNADFSVYITSKEEKIPAQNVLGYVEGSDLKEEVIVISAHYDHIGVQDGKVFNGADDDGSGTVAVMDLAEAFAQAKADGHGPRRSILFITVSGEEMGLLGSTYYTNHPVYPLENTVANLNIDMIGRLDENHAENENYIYLIGSDKLSSELHDISEKANVDYSNLELDYTFNAPDDPNRFYYRSDHYNFAKNNIPVIFYFNGVHEDYHKHTYTVDKILFDKMEKITRLVFHTAWQLANQDKRIAADKVNDFK
jgi:hypothetical protein